MSKQRNTKLEALLAEFDYTHQQLADVVNQVTVDLFGKSTECTDRHVRRWISGDVRWPWPKYLLALQEIFGRSPEAMGFIPRGKASHVPPPPRRATAVKVVPPVRRRDFITAGLAAAIGIDVIPMAGRLGSADIDRLRKIVPALYTHDHVLGGGALHTVAAEALGRLRDALNRCTYGERVERQLYVVAGDLAASAGWFAYDAGHQQAATHLYNEALQAAILAGDGSLQARVWSNLAMQARLLGRDQEAVRIGRAAVETRRAKGDPWLMTLLHCRQAVGHAHVGERGRAERSLARAESAYGRVSGEPEAWLTFLTAAELTGLAGAAHQALGQHRRAQELTASALRMLEPRFERNRFYYTVQRAQALLDSGEVEEAASEAARASSMNQRVQSDRVRKRFADLRHNMGRHHRVAAVSDFLEQLRHTED